MPSPPIIELPGFPPIPILHEDPRCLALDKPVGVVCAATRTHPDASDLQQALDAAIAAGAPWAQERGLTYLRIVRALESELSGVLLLTRTAGNVLAYSQAIEARHAVREYLAVVGGKPPKRRWTCCLKIRPDPAKPSRVLTHTQQGQFAETDFEIIGHGDGMALVLARLRTARPHQIRAHLAASGLPIVGDTVYGFGRKTAVKQPGALPRVDAPRTRKRAPELALRAIRLAFDCPGTREPVEIVAPLDDFLANYGFEGADESIDDATENAEALRQPE